MAFEEKRSEQDPLADLHQMDHTNGAPLEGEAAYLITRLLENIEEFYVLKDQMKDVVVMDERTGTKVVELLSALINGLREEESRLRKVDIMPLTYRVTHSFFRS